MSDFSVDKKIYITHFDDHFRYIVYTEDDPVSITIEYQERMGDGDYCMVDKLDGIYKNSALNIANALIELAELAD